MAESVMGAEVIVKFFNSEKGFGFFTSETHGDLFVHRSVLERYGFEDYDMEEGFPAVVDFEIREGKKQVIAIKEIAITIVKKGKVFSLPQEGYSYDGVIMKYDSQKGFGYLAVTVLEREVFFHVSQVRDADPQVGKTYHFEMGRNSRGFCAVQMTALVDDSEPVAAAELIEEVAVQKPVVTRVRRKKSENSGAGLTVH